MRRLMVLALCLLLAACSRPAAPTQPGSPDPEPAPLPAESKPLPPLPPPPAEQVQVTVPPAVTAWVGPDRDGPWLPYRPGIHIPGDALWVKLEADQPLPDPLDKSLTANSWQPRGFRVERLTDRAVLLTVPGPGFRLFGYSIGGVPGPVILAFRGEPPVLREVDPGTGAVRTLATLEELPAATLLPRYDPQERAIRYAREAGDGEVLVRVEVSQGAGVGPERPAVSGPLAPVRYKAEFLVPGQSPIAPGTALTLRVLEEGTDRLVWELPAWSVVPDREGCIPLWPAYAWSPDGTRLASITAVGKGQVGVQLLDVTTGDTRVLAIREAGSEFDWASASWSPDNRYLATSGASNPRSLWGPVRLIEVESGKSLLEATGMIVAWTPAGRLLYIDWQNGPALPVLPYGCE